MEKVKIKNKIKLAILFISIILLTPNFLPVTSEGEEGKITARIIFSPEPILDWQTPQKYDVTIQIMKQGTITLDTNDTDDMAATGNIIVDVDLASVAKNRHVIYHLDGYSAEGGSYKVAGSVIETSFDDFVTLVNLTSIDKSLPLPMDEKWHNVFAFTCYYDVPVSFPFPEQELVGIALDFNINVYSELAGVLNETENAVISATFQGDNLGHSFYEYTLLEIEPIPIPLDDSSQTSTVTPTAKLSTETPNQQTPGPTEVTDSSDNTSPVSPFNYDLFPIFIAAIAIIVLFSIAIIVKVKG